MEKEKLLKWLSEKLVMNVSEKTVFLQDLKLADLDIDIFFLEFLENFNIDDSLLNIEDYTLDNSNIIDIWFKGKKAKTFNADHLLKVIALKKWYDADEIDKHLES